MNKNELAQHQKNLQSIADLYLDGQPYDQLRLINETTFCLAQSAASMLEAGKRLIVIKENETHGEFINVIENKLGMSQAVARRFMGAAAKFMGPTLAGKKGLIELGKTKLYELMLEEDEDLAALADGGTVAGLTLDDIDCMSSRELRKKLRDARADNEAKSEVIIAKDKKINNIVMANKKLKPVTMDEENKAIRTEASKVVFEAEAAIRQPVWDALKQVLEHGQANDLSVGSWLNGCLTQLEDTITDIRNDLLVFNDSPEEFEAEGLQATDAEA